MPKEIILQRFATGRAVAVLFAVMVIFNVLLLSSAPEGVEAIDLQFAYTPDEAYSLMAAYTEDFRSRYILAELTLDIAYPVTYTLMMSFSLFLLYGRRVFPAVLTYAIFVSDLLENFGIVFMLVRFPDRFDALAWGTSIFSTIKWVLVVVCTLLILWGLIRKMIKKPIL